MPIPSKLDLNKQFDARYRLFRSQVSYCWGFKIQIASIFIQAHLSYETL